MDIQIVSDLHIDSWGFGLREPLPFGPEHVKGDVLVIAGDVCEGLTHLSDYMKTLDEVGVPILFVPGNHEYFFYDMITYRTRLRSLLRPLKNVTVLDCEEKIFNGVRFIGATLWTNFGLSKRKMMDCENVMPEYEFVKADWEGMPLTADDVLARHEEDLNWMDERLSEKFDGPSVVVSHHAPSYRSISKRFLGNSANPGFVSDLSNFVRKHNPALWIHGHTHDSLDYVLDKTRIICNSCGYKGERQDKKWEPKNLSISP